MPSLEEAIVHGESKAVEEHILDVVSFAFFGVKNAVVSNGKISLLPASDTGNDVVVTLFHARSLVVPPS